MFNIEEVQEVIDEAREESEAFDLWYQEVTRQAGRLWGMTMAAGNEKVMAQAKELSDTISCLE